MPSAEQRWVADNLNFELDQDRASHLYLLVQNANKVGVVNGQCAITEGDKEYYIQQGVNSLPRVDELAPIWKEWITNGLKNYFTAHPKSWCDQIPNTALKPIPKITPIRPLPKPTTKLRGTLEQRFLDATGLMEFAWLRPFLSQTYREANQVGKDKYGNCQLKLGDYRLRDEYAAKAKLNFEHLVWEKGQFENLGYWTTPEDFIAFHEQVFMNAIYNYAFCTPGDKHNLVPLDPRTPNTPLKPGLKPIALKPAPWSWTRWMIVGGLGLGAAGVIYLIYKKVSYVAPAAPPTSSIYRNTRVY